MSRLIISREDLSPLVEIVTWLCLVISALTVSVRFMIKLWVIRKFNLDDTFIALSLSFALVESILISIATTNGLGQRLGSLSATQISKVLKTQYAANIFFIASGCFAKLSLVLFLRRLTPLAFHKFLGLFIKLAVGVWSITALFGSAFQCQLPHPWDYLHNSCFNRTAFDNYVAIGNMLTDVGLIVFPLLITAHLKVKASKRIGLAFLFLARACVITAVICQLVYGNRLGPQSDLLFEIWPVTICAQVAQCLSILTACTVYLKPFMDALESGFIQIGDLRRQHAEGFGYSPENVTKKSKGSKGSKQSSKLKERISQEQIELQSIERPAKRGGDNGFGDTVVARAEPGNWDGDSRFQILQTRTWTVEDDYENNGRATIGEPQIHYGLRP